MAIDAKYGRVTLEHGSIAADEPVIVFRANDQLLPKVLAYYNTLCMLAGSPKRHLDLIFKSLGLVLEWQGKYGFKRPESESSREWLGD